MKPRVVFLALNELNFEYIRTYVDLGELPNFKWLLDEIKGVTTTSEVEDELLEPWIQWVTVHTGKDFHQHNVFRLGDIVGRLDLKQVWEVIEERGFTVGAVSPFNAENRLLKAPFFIPDPWTVTKASGTFLDKKLAYAVSQAVNDNARNKVSIDSYISLFLGGLVHVPLKYYFNYLQLVCRMKSRPWVRALILDSLLIDVFLSNMRKYTPDFSWLFLNSGAHIQHHYMYNSKAYKGDLENPEWYCPKDEDPLIEVLKVYDGVLGRLRSIGNLRLLMGTGLHQVPYKELTYYWRLKEPAVFLRLIDIKDFVGVDQRMSRDFLVQFKSTDATLAAENILLSFKRNGEDTVFEVDNRGESLFVTLVYPHVIERGFCIGNKEQKVRNFYEYVSFVALKNGEHSAEGYFVDTGTKDLPSIMPLRKIYTHILSIFDN